MKTRKIIAATTLSVLAGGATVCLMAKEVIKMIETGLPIEQNDPNGAMCIFLIGAMMTSIPWMIVNVEKALGASIIVLGCVGAFCFIYMGVVSSLAEIGLCYPISYFVLAAMMGSAVWVGNGIMRL